MPDIQGLDFSILYQGAGYGSPQENDLGMFASNVPITTKDDVYFVSAGGGGYGSPLERDPQNKLIKTFKGTTRS
jgi:hypothetical protein